MLTDSLLLSVFFGLFLIVEILLFPVFDFSFMSRGKILTISKKMTVAILAAAIFLSVSISSIVISKSSPELLQIFYIVLFVISLTMTLFFLLNLKRTYIRLLLSLSVSICLLYLLSVYPTSLTQNLFMSASILWVGIVVFKRFNVRLKYFIPFMLFFAIIDSINVYVLKTYTTFSDELFILNGLVAIGPFILGIGDFFLAYLIVSAARRYHTIWYALLLAVLLPLPRFFIRVLIPELEGAEFPYSIFMVPIALLVYTFAAIQKRIQNTAKSNQYLGQKF